MNMLRPGFQGTLLLAFELHVSDLDFFPAQTFSNLVYLHMCMDQLIHASKSKELISSIPNVHLSPLYQPALYTP